MADPSRHQKLKQRGCFRQTDRKTGLGAGREDRLDGIQEMDRQAGGQAVRWAEGRGWGQAG